MAFCLVGKDIARACSFHIIVVAVPDLIRLGLPEAVMVTQPILRIAGKLAHAPSLHSYLRVIKDHDALAAFESWCGGLANRYSAVSRWLPEYMAGEV